MFADDHQLSVTHKNVDVIQQKLQNSAVTATDWYEGTFSKYPSMLIGKGKLDATLNINIKVCSDEGLTLETSAKHHIPQATNIPYQPC